MKLRNKDEFTLFLRKGSAKEPRFSAFLKECAPVKPRLVSSNRSRKVSNFLALMRWCRAHEVAEPADFYFNPDFDFMGYSAFPALYTIFDISAIRQPKHSSMPWHGTHLRRFALTLLAATDFPVVATSEFTRRDLEAYDNRLAGRVSVICCGIDEVWFERPSPCLIARRFGLDRPYWIWYGYITRRKNVDGLLRGFSTLVRGHADPASIPDLALVGTLGRDSKSIPRLAKSLGIADRVHFIPFLPREDLIQLVAQSRGLVFPSHYEGFGLPCIEAMAQGRPALVADRTCQPEIAGGWAALCDPSSDESIAVGLLALLNSDLWSTTQVEGRRQWAARFTHQAAAIKYSELLDLVWSEHERKRRGCTSPSSN